MNRLILSITLFAVVGLSGCANPAHYVVREDTGGIVAIPNNSNAWPSYNRRHAEELMSNHYPDGYEIIREGEKVTGPGTGNDSQIRPALFAGDEQTATNSPSATDRTEWHIYYRPKGSSGFAEPIDPNLSPVRNVGRPRGLPLGPRGDMMPSNPQFKPTLNAGN